jgi:hypothetical protein
MFAGWLPICCAYWTGFFEGCFEILLCLQSYDGVMKKPQLSLLMEYSRGIDLNSKLIGFHRECPRLYLYHTVLVAEEFTHCQAQRTYHHQGNEELKKASLESITTKCVRKESYKSGEVESLSQYKL